MAYKAYRGILCIPRNRFRQTCTSHELVTSILDFMRLDKLSAKKLGVSTDEIHATHWYLNEHPHGLCSMNCVLNEWFDNQKGTLEDFMESKIAHLYDLPKSEYAAYLFGGLEPPGKLFTTAHEFVIIDSEMMFTSGPDENTVHWWYESDGHPSRSKLALALEVCSDLISLSENQIEEALRIPTGVKIREDSPIASKLKASRKFAAQFCALHK
ncbi:hypothetical protein [Nitrosomonas ureae]|uniref:Uncharacterized protein n=1 Tax=Nitrosomonas ureae TaxID=44577 RepID=A0A1H9D8L8_9PROT|nr:hypothetical protein [Nitrosomonas ureae]SEQ09687.1 hypothetical protein SAMN05421510_102022 [Nitrosomonas ureae]